MDTQTQTWISIAEDFARAMSGAPGAREAAFRYESALRRILAYTTRMQLQWAEDEGEDALQSIYMRMLEHRAQAPTDPTAFRKWVYCIRRSVVVDMLRRGDRYETLPQVDPAANEPDVLTRLCQEEDEARCREAIDALPADLAEVVRLRVLEGVRPDDIAQQLKLRTRILRRRMKRAARYLSHLFPDGIRAGA